MFLFIKSTTVGLTGLHLTLTCCCAGHLSCQSRPVFGPCIADVTHPQDEVSSPDDPSSGKQISKYWILVVVILVVGVLCLAGHALVAYRLWHHKQRKEEQARFVQLFEDDESLEEEQDLKDDQIVDVWWLDLAPTTKKLDRGISI